MGWQLQRADGTRIPLTGERVTLGSEAEIKVPGAAPKHARLERVAGQWVLTAEANQSLWLDGSERRVLNLKSGVPVRLTSRGETLTLMEDAAATPTGGSPAKAGAKSFAITPLFAAAALLAALGGGWMVWGGGGPEAGSTVPAPDPNDETGLTTGAKERSQPTDEKPIKSESTPVDLKAPLSKIVSIGATLSDGTETTSFFGTGVAVLNAHTFLTTASQATLIRNSRPDVQRFFVRQGDKKSFIDPGSVTFAPGWKMPQSLEGWQGKGEFADNKYHDIALVRCRDEILDFVPERDWVRTSPPAYNGETLLIAGVVITDPTERFQAKGWDDSNQRPTVQPVTLKESVPLPGQDLHLFNTSASNAAASNSVPLVQGMGVFAADGRHLLGMTLNDLPKPTPSWVPVRRLAE